jgi:hypothetical protein
MVVSLFSCRSVPQDAKATTTHSHPHPFPSPTDASTRPFTPHTSLQSHRRLTRDPCHTHTHSYTHKCRRPENKDNTHTYTYTPKYKHREHLLQMQSVHRPFPSPIKHNKRPPPVPLLNKRLPVLHPSIRRFHLVKDDMQPWAKNPTPKQIVLTLYPCLPLSVPLCLSYTYTQHEDVSITPPSESLLPT